MWRSVSTKRCSVSSEASSIGVCDVPSPSTILAIRLFLVRSASLLSSPRRRGPITTDLSILHPWCHIAWLRRKGPRFRVAFAGTTTERPPSIDLHIRGLADRGPFLDLRRDEGPELGGRARIGHGAEPRDRGLHLLGAQ